MRNFIDPYLPPIFECEESLDTVDLCDSSGYLSLQDQISIITNQSEINNEFRRGMIDNNNDENSKIYEALSEFESNEYVTDRLQQARVGDLIDKEQILTDAYNAGYATSFFQHRPKMWSVRALRALALHVEKSLLHIPHYRRQ